MSTLQSIRLVRYEQRCVDVQNTNKFTIDDVMPSHIAPSSSPKQYTDDGKTLSYHKLRNAFLIPQLLIPSSYCNHKSVAPIVTNTKVLQRIHENFWRIDS